MGNLCITRTPPHFLETVLQPLREAIINTPIEKSLHWETISTAMRQVMNAFGRTKISARFFLAGETALALQIGHRRSLDLDFFSTTEDIPEIRQPLKDALLTSFELVLRDYRHYVDVKSRRDKSYFRIGAG